jgi:hypothetical protein
VPSLGDQILKLLGERPGLTDRQITNALRGKEAPQQPINLTCRNLATRGRLWRRYRQDGLIGNYPVDAATDVADPPRSDLEPRRPPSAGRPAPGLSEDEVKAAISSWLQANGWGVRVAEGRSHGVDIEARRRGERWVIEAKGVGSRPEMRLNYFLGILGTVLQRMSDEDATYSIALPDYGQYERLWQRLPRLAKERTGISLLLVAEDRTVRQLR